MLNRKYKHPHNLLIGEPRSVLTITRSWEDRGGDGKGGKEKKDQGDEKEGDRRES